MASQEGIEGIEARLNNIRSVEPILGAMRTISLGSWQAALRRRQQVLAYADRVLSLLAPILSSRPVGRPRARGAPAGRAVTVVLGSERGLCGAFNSTLAHYVVRELAARGADEVEPELHCLGTRATRALRRLGIEATISRPLPTAALPTSDLASELTDTWLARYEAYEIDSVQVLYNTYRSAAAYEPISVQLIPPPVPPPSASSAPWPPPYVDTDAIALLARVAVLWATTELYRILLDSAAAEHAARYQLMEGATQNSARLIDELTLAMQAARQQAITAEMQELAAGAGLLGSPEE